MNCPKCSARLAGQTVVSRASALHNTDGVVNFVQGLSCWRCGTWVDGEAVSPAIAREVDFSRERAGHAQLMQIHPVIEEFFDSIKRLRAENTTWETVAHLIRKATGVKYLKVSTVRRHYQALAGVRGGM